MTKKKLGREEKNGQPVVRLRSMLIGLCVLVGSIALPLVLVWKQSYVNQVSIRLEYKADTLASLRREITSLELERGRLSSPARIERLARARGLEYPVSGQLEVLEVKMPRQKKNRWIGGFFTFVKQTFSGKSGR
ncbi:MAG: hypothetical protein LBC70_01555 [Chitinispirillales bacterium]|jgi:cell division protein FtsL|nr:hypothetical protein [Chitinispirillales bacterium]